MNTYAYVRGHPVSLTDPTGLCPWCIGAGIGAAVELGMQAYGNYKEGCDAFSTDNYDWQDVVVSAAVGAVAPGMLLTGKTGYTGIQAIQTISRQSANTLNRALKNQAKINVHVNTIATTTGAQVGAAVVNQVGKKIVGNGNASSCTCKKDQK